VPFTPSLLHSFTPSLLHSSTPSLLHSSTTTTTTTTTQLPLTRKPNLKTHHITTQVSPPLHAAPTVPSSPLSLYLHACCSNSTVLPALTLPPCMLLQQYRPPLPSHGLTSVAEGAVVKYSVSSNRWILRSWRGMWRRINTCGMKYRRTLRSAAGIISPFSTGTLINHCYTVSTLYLH
jgi:hypothetical protein